MWAETKLDNDGRGSDAADSAGNAGVRPATKPSTPLPRPPLGRCPQSEDAPPSPRSSRRGPLVLGWDVNAELRSTLPHLPHRKSYGKTRLVPRISGATRPDSATPPLSQCGAKIGHEVGAGLLDAAAPPRPEP